MATERILAHGIPTTSWAAISSGVQRRTFADPGTCNEGALGSFAGNSMHAACVGAAVAWALVHTRLGHELGGCCRSESD